MHYIKNNINNINNNKNSIYLTFLFEHNHSLYNFCNNDNNNNNLFIDTFNYFVKYMVFIIII